MRASIIIPTYNGADKIHHLLRALVSQTNRNFEILVVIDGSTDHTEQVISPFKDQFEEFKIISQKNSGRARVRNTGAREASNSLLIFYDDDMIPSENSVGAHVDFHQRSLRSSLICGNAIEIEEKGNTDIQNYKAHISSRWISKYDAGVNELDLSTIFFTAANSSMPKTVFDDLGGFDERLTDMEDYDLAFRALKRGVNVYFDKSNLAIHRDLITASGYVNRIRQYRSARLKWFELHQSEIPLEKVGIRLKRILYAPFSFSFWIRAIDENLLLWIPRTLRYRLYDIIIQSAGVEFPK